MTYVELSQAKTDLERLVNKASSGEEVVITRDGKPVARLVAAAEDAGAERVPGSARGLFTVPDDFDAPLEDFREYESTAPRYPLRGLPVTLVDPTAPIVDG